MKRSLSPSVKPGHRRSHSDSTMLQILGSRRSSAASGDGLTDIDGSNMLAFAEEDCYELALGGETFIDLGGSGSNFQFDAFDMSDKAVDFSETRRRRSSSGNSNFNFFLPPPGDVMTSPNAPQRKGHRRVQSAEAVPLATIAHLDSMEDMEMQLARASDLSAASFLNDIPTPKEGKETRVGSTLNLQFPTGAEDTVGPMPQLSNRQNSVDSNKGSGSRARTGSTMSNVSDDLSTEQRDSRLSLSDLNCLRDSTTSVDWDENLMPNPEKDGVAAARYELPSAPAATDVFGETAQAGGQQVPVYQSRSGLNVLNSSGNMGGAKPLRSPRGSLGSGRQRKVKPDDGLGAAPGFPGAGLVGSVGSNGVFVRMGNDGPVFTVPRPNYSADATLYQLHQQTRGGRDGSPAPTGRKGRSPNGNGGATRPVKTQAPTADAPGGAVDLNLGGGQNIFKNRGRYKCSRCGQPKANHVCPFDAPPSRSMWTQVDLRVTKGIARRDQTKERVLIVNRRSQWAMEAEGGRD